MPDDDRISKRAQGGGKVAGGSGFLPGDVVARIAEFSVNKDLKSLFLVSQAWLDGASRNLGPRLDSMLKEVLDLSWRTSLGNSHRKELISQRGVVLGDAGAAAGRRSAAGSLSAEQRQRYISYRGYLERDAKACDELPEGRDPHAGSDADRNATVVLGDADRNATVVLGDADRNVTVVPGDADRNATVVLGEADSNVGSVERDLTGVPPLPEGVVGLEPSPVVPPQGLEGAPRLVEVAGTATELRPPARAQSASAMEEHSNAILQHVPVTCRRGRT
jgi:hypothetical protein